MSWLKYLIGAALAGVLAHVIVVREVPRVLMRGAIERLSQDGASFNTWRRTERVTEASRTIVRPSPDLQYAACPYDLSRGPVVIRVTAWPRYWSLSLYAETSDNYFVLDDREAREGAEIILVRKGQQTPEDAERVIESPTQRGVALVRRLAPSAADFEAAIAASQNDACASLH